jgi:hypothetical protein
VEDATPTNATITVILISEAAKTNLSLAEDASNF